MIRRWIIRGLGIALLILCVTAWVGSYIQGVAVSHSSNRDAWVFGLEGGQFELIHGVRDATGYNVWSWVHARFRWEMRAGMQTGYELSPYHLLGFAWKPLAPKQPWQLVLIPLWFPTLLSALLLWLVWRKTRPKYSGKGFPVEVGGGGGRGGGKDATKA